MSDVFAEEHFQELLSEMKTMDWLGLEKVEEPGPHMAMIMEMSNDKIPWLFSYRSIPLRIWRSDLKQRRIVSGLLKARKT